MVNKKLLFWIISFMFCISLVNALDPWYNVTNFTDKDNLVGIFKVANDYTKGVFGIITYLGFFLLMLYLFSGYQPKEAFAASTFITALVGIVMMPLNIINPWVILIMIVGAVGSLVSLFW